MKKSILLLAPFATLVACFGKEKPQEATAEQTTEACQVENVSSAAPVEVKAEEAAPAEESAAK